MPDRYGVPEIFESEASEELKLIYQDIKYILKVPVVNFIFRALAHYNKFLEIGWMQVRKSMLTTEMEAAAAKLRNPDISFIPPKINLTKSYSPGDADIIRKIIFTFDYVNAKLLLIASAWSESLSNRPVDGSGSFSCCIVPGIIPGLPEIQLVNFEEATPEIKSVFKDITNKHHTYDIASDFRALANYPNFLTESWSIMRNFVGTDEFNLTTARLRTSAIELAHKMPYPVTINRNMLEYYYSDTDIAGIMGVVSMFNNFLPGLIIDTEVLRRMVYDSLIKNFRPCFIIL